MSITPLMPVYPRCGFRPIRGDHCHLIGEDGRRYPWGDPWEPTHAHHRGNARHTLPVGCFPAGASPHGLLDAAGNVWEWCDGSYGASDLLRPARGGGWNAHPPQLRCASRNGWPPDAQFSNIGFRTAR